MAYLGRKGATAPLNSADIPDNSVTSAKIGVDVIVAEDIANNAVTVAELSDNAVTQAKLADNAVGTAEIADDAVTADKLANSINTDIATGVTANTTANAALPKAGGTMSGAVTGMTNLIVSSAGTTSPPWIAQLLNTGGGADDNGVLIKGGSTTNEYSLNVANESGTSLLAVKGDGKVGISTTAPAKKLEVFTGTSGDGIRLTYDAATDYVNGILLRGDTLDICANTTATGAGGDIRFNVGGETATKMIVDVAGRVGIGCTDPMSALDIRGNAAGFTMGVNTSTNYYRRSYIYNTGSSANLYWYNGSNEAYLTAAGAWTNASDERIKKDITDIEYGLAEVLASKPRQFKMKADDLPQVGFIAQEMIDIIPEVVDGGESDADKPEELRIFDDGKTQYGLNYGALVAVAFKAIQELSAKVTALENA